MKRTLVAAALLAAFGLTAHAAIAPGTSGNGELFFTIQDPEVKVSYTLDLGIRMNDFIGGEGAPTGTGIGDGLGVALSFAVAADPLWADFLSQVSVDALRWAVIAIDSTGNNNPHQQRLLTTSAYDPAKTLAENEAPLRNVGNQGFSLGTSAVQAGNFFNAINNTGSHPPQSDYTINGSSINPETESGRAYFGEAGGLTPTYNGGFGNARSTNVVGGQSFFYYVTRSSTSNLTTAKVLIDAFGNDIGMGVWAFDGQTLSYTTPVPEPGTYALMLLGMAGIGALVRHRSRA
jgi:hypothetical protein